MKRKAEVDPSAREFRRLSHDPEEYQVKRRRFVSPMPDKKQRPREEKESHISPSEDKTPQTTNPVGQMNQKETDPHKLAQRQKQIDFGKNTIGYDRYIEAVPKYVWTPFAFQMTISCRSRRKRNVHPSTPDKYAVASKRAWDGRIQAWRRHLHQYDPETKAEAAPTPSFKPNPSPAVAKVEPTLRHRPPAQGSLFDDFEEEAKESTATLPVSMDDEDDLL
ncbi:Aste57867_23902 [Aphanomyces stellatus]|uniref:Aste57867_23902 protein n=1 Tax=Aphanomyces stellatus TaxID=120398 RepID=A0A485LQ19_9STRA|nr:hypothetical protein As57867_023829 [Aphanomyces stellatus]VFU00545.1 Aste57867_23902 [Aphanomyces stellatus]